MASEKKKISRTLQGIVAETEFHVDVHPIHKKAYEIKLQLDWLISKTIILRKSWKAEFNPSTVSFDSFIYDMEVERIHCRQLMSVIEFSPEEIRWVEHLRRRKDSFRYYFDIMTNAYNEQIEGKQISTSIEPMVYIGDKAGIHDQLINIESILMKTYHGRIKDSSLVTPSVSDQGFDLKKLNEPLKDAFIFNEWDGIVTTTSGRDFRILPDYQLFCCPTYIKLVNHSLLSPIAHEAGHQMLFYARQLYWNHTTFGNKLDDDDYPPFLELLLIWTNLMKEFIGEKRVPIEDMPFKAYKDNLKKARSDDFFIKVDGMDDLFCDLLAAIVAGPSFFLSLYHFALWNPTYYPGQHPNYIQQLSILDRLYMGRAIMKTLKRDSENVWYNQLNEIITNIEDVEKGIESTLKENPPNKETIEGLLNRAFIYPPTDRSIYQEATSPIPRDRGGDQSCIFERLLERMHLFSFRKDRIEGIFRDEYYLNLLNDFFERNFDPNPTVFSEVQGDDLHEKYLELARVSTEISRKIHFKSELALEDPIQLVVTASESPPIRRPAYPTGRIYYSILWNNNKPNIF